MNGSPYVRRDRVVADYRLQDFHKAEAERDRLLALGEDAFCTRNIGAGRAYVHINPKPGA